MGLDEGQKLENTKMKKMCFFDLCVLYLVRDVT